MMMQRIASAAVALTFVALTGCDKPSGTEPKLDDPSAKNTTTTNATATGAAQTPTPAPAPVTIDESVLSTPADFEEEAEKAITPKTYKAELATLEAEVTKD